MREELRDMNFISRKRRENGKKLYLKLMIENFPKLLNEATDLRSTTNPKQDKYRKTILTISLLNS